MLCLQEVALCGGERKIRNLEFSDLRKGSEQKTDSEAYEL